MRKAARCLRCSGRSRRSTRIPAGWSTTRRTSCLPSWEPSPSFWFRTASRRPTSTASASRTNARPRSCGTARRASRSSTPSCGSAAAPRPSSRAAPPTRTSCATIREKTGLVPDAYFSASKDQVDPRQRAGGTEAGRERQSCAFGTVDTWLALDPHRTAQVHATDVTNASRTMLYNIHEGRWDPWLLDLFGIPASLMPEVRPSAGDFGRTANPGTAQGVPICGVAGDQQAALFGQCCFDARRGQEHVRHRLLPADAHRGTRRARRRTNLRDHHCRIGSVARPREYALEGSVFVARRRWCSGCATSCGLIETAADSRGVWR